MTAKKQPTPKPRPRLRAAGPGRYLSPAQAAKLPKAEVVAETAPRYVGRPAWAIRRTDDPADGWLGGTDDRSGWPDLMYYTKGEAVGALRLDGLGHSRSRVVRVRLVES